ncbi:hypothetical protein TGAM01_v208446 [Trichoderma gamsii]|uniref:Uncharacterized protein n=1 Tax=Trichoderma gamsii TaxID=398673 RepID=A0A2P4ZEP8_9HYPO|nr:hypothetical protein TGAM01_v208446 [Trichoderma gamsii]PON22760.1 hypothetical protein TGAM01_v208446 [Trichoderma gamsii]
MASRQGSAKRGLFRATTSSFYLPNDRGISVGKDAERERAVDSENGNRLRGRSVDSNRG